MTQTSEQAFHNALSSKTNDARKALKNCLFHFMTGKPHNRKSMAEEAYVAVERLNGILDEADKPGWLGPMLGRLNTMRQQPDSDVAVEAAREQIYNNLHALEHHKWVKQVKPVSEPIDADAIYRKHRDDSGITKLSHRWRTEE